MLCSQKIAVAVTFPEKSMKQKCAKRTDGLVKFSWLDGLILCQKGLIYCRIIHKLMLEEGRKNMRLDPLKNILLCPRKNAVGITFPEYNQ